MVQNKRGIGRSLTFCGEQFGLWSMVVAPCSCDMSSLDRRISLSSKTPYRCSTSLGQDQRVFIHILQILCSQKKK